MIASTKHLRLSKSPLNKTPNILRYPPMLASAAEQPPDAPCAFEIKWDGVRAIAQFRKQKLTFFSRNALDITSHYPEIQPLSAALKCKSAVLDGEIVALDDNGIPNFNLLQSRLHITSAAIVSARASRTPAHYMIFDLLELNGKALINLPYAERRRRLKSLQLEGSNWRTPDALDATFEEAFEAVQRIQLEGLVAKRLDGVYYPGKRSPAWTKIKIQRRQELVIAGWQAGKGNREGLPGAVLIGYYNEKKELVYAGQCGTGFGTSMLQELQGLMNKLKLTSNPFVVHAPRGKDIHFVQPVLVAEFKFTEWTPDGMLRHPVFLGLRQDKNATEVIREPIAK